MSRAHLGCGALAVGVVSICCVGEQDAPAFALVFVVLGVAYLASLALKTSLFSANNEHGETE